MAVSCGWSTGRPSGGEVSSSSLEESLLCCPNMVSLDEQRQSVVLELYCRKAERKREGKRKRGDGHGHMGERGEGRGKRRARDERKVKA